MSVPNHDRAPRGTSSDVPAPAKAAAKAALRAWVEEVLSGVVALSAQAGTGGAPAVVFTGRVRDDVDPFDVDWEQREELVSVVFATEDRQVTLSTTSGPRWQWAAAVELWDDLRTALAHTYATEVPPGLLVDLAGWVVYCFEPWYCPDIGPEPIAVFDLEDDEDSDVDPFTQLLADAHADVAALDRRLDDLLETHRLTAPTVPGHDEGACGLDPADGPDDDYR